MNIEKLSSPKHQDIVLSLRRPKQSWKVIQHVLHWSGVQKHDNKWMLMLLRLLDYLPPIISATHRFGTGRTPQTFWDCLQRGSRFLWHRQRVRHVRSSSNTWEHKPGRHRKTKRQKNMTTFSEKCLTLMSSLKHRLCNHNLATVAKHRSLFSKRWEWSLKFGGWGHFLAKTEKHKSKYKFLLPWPKDYIRLANKTLWNNLLEIALLRDISNSQMLPLLANF